MRWTGRRRGVFEGPPRALFRRAEARYLDVVLAVVVGNGVVVALFGTVAVALFVRLDASELLVFAACLAAGFAVEALVAVALVRGATAAIRGRREDATAAWSAAARLPLDLVRHPVALAAGLVATAVASLVLARVLGLPAREAARALPALLPLYASAVVLRHLGVELAMRPVLDATGADLDGPPPVDAARVSLHARLVVAIPMVTWGAGVLVAGLLTDDARELVTLGAAGAVAVGVSAALSIWLGLVLADAVTGPIADLRDATRRVAAGDLAVRAPVVSTDETGELAASFNAMVAGLDERERLREAFGVFVDPVVAERVLAEGTDLHGEELEVSVVFLDVRDFTAYAERAPAHEVVALLNELYDAVVPVVLRHGGHVSRFIGDGLLAVFGAPERHADHAARAVAAARETAELVPERLGGRLRVGLGVNSGLAVVGTIGGGGRRDFTVIGDVVNTAARVEAATRLTGDDVLVTEATLRELGADAEDFEERPAAPLKGKTTTVRLYAPR